MTDQPKDLTQEEKATNSETWAHIDVVNRLLASAQIELMRRQFTHDRSKLVAPEVEIFAEYTAKLKGSTYGSEEYKKNLAEMGDAITHHYAHNRHHPEHYAGGARGQGVVELKRIDSQNFIAAPDDIYIYLNLQRYLEQRKAEIEAPINGMTLFDLIEMLCDWVAAVRRHDNGDIDKSLEVNQQRFSISPQLQQILENTIPWIQDEFDTLTTQRNLSEVPRTTLVRKTQPIV